MLSRLYEVAATAGFSRSKVMAEYMQVLTTVDSISEEAQRLGRSVTGVRLAACVQIIEPVLRSLVNTELNSCCATSHAVGEVGESEYSI